MTLQSHNKYFILQLLLNPIAVVLHLVLKLKLVLNSRIMVFQLVLHPATTLQLVNLTPTVVQLKYYWML